MTILIAAPELIPALRERLGGGDDILTFADSEPLRALERVAAERPRVLALERLFAASPRGAALISRVKADPALEGCQILILAHDSGYRRVSPRRRKPVSGAVKTHARKTLDVGTRRATRVRLRSGVVATVDKESAYLVDLSPLGAQLLLGRGLAPGQEVELKMDPSGAGLSVTAVVIWAKLEMVGRLSRYRAGVSFTRADATAITAFAEENRGE
jgi:hypothetical protein